MLLIAIMSADCTISVISSLGNEVIIFLVPLAQLTRSFHCDDNYRGLNLSSLRVVKRMKRFQLVSMLYKLYIK